MKTSPSDALFLIVRIWIDDDKMLLCLNDLDLVKMLELKDRDEDPSEVIDKTVRSFRQSL